MKWIKKKEDKKGWKDITLRQGIELSELDIDDNWELVLNQMAIILDTTMDEIESKPAALVYEFINDYGFLKDLPDMKELKGFKSGGKNYRLIDLGSMSLAQMVDIEEYYKMGLVKNLHKILSVLYLPAKRNIFGKWVIEEYKPDEERENVFLDMDMETVYGAILFFWVGVKTYLKGLTDYFKMTDKEMKMILNQTEE